MFQNINKSSVVLLTYRVSIFYMSDEFIGCWLLTDRISIFYLNYAIDAIFYKNVFDVIYMIAPCFAICPMFTFLTESHPPILEILSLLKIQLIIPGWKIVSIICFVA